MGRVVVPAKEILVCDRCKARGERGREGAFLNGGLHIKNADMWGRCYDGGAGGALVSFDFCAACAASFDAWRGSTEVPDTGADHECG